MATFSPKTIRGGLLGIFTLLTAGLVAPTVFAQIRPPGFPPPLPPLPPRPPIGIPGGIGGMPGGIGGMPGGIGGPGIGGIGGTVIEHTCGKCRAVMARNNMPGGFTGTCPGCGLRYTFGTAFDDGTARPGMGGGFPPPPPVMPFAPPPGPQPQPFNPGQPFNPNPVPPAQPVNADLPAVNANDFQPGNTPVPGAGLPGDLGSGGTPTPATNSAPAPKSSNRALFIIGGVVLGLIVILGMVVGVLYVKANAKKTTKIRRRTSRIDD